MGKITLIANLQNNISAGLNSIAAGATKVAATVGAAGARAGAAAVSLTKLAATVGLVSSSASAAAGSFGKMTVSTDRQGMSTSRLIVMMVKFGIILKALQIVTSPLGWMGEGVTSATALDKGLRNIVGMMANADETGRALEQRYRNLTINARNLQSQFGMTADDTVAGLYKIGSVIDSLNFDGAPEGVDRTTFALDKLGQIAGRNAVGGMTDMKTSADAITTILAAMNIKIMDAEKVSDILFQTVRVGKAEFADVANNAGDFVGILSAMSKEGNELRDLQDVMGIYGFLTTFLGPAEAGTSTKRMLEFVTNKTTESIALAKQLRDVSGGALRLSASEVVEQGFGETFRQLAKYAGPQSEELRTFFEDYEGRPLTEDEMFGRSLQIFRKIFGDSRALRGALRTLAEDGGASLEQLFDTMDKGEGAANRAFGQGKKSWAQHVEELNSAINTMAQDITSGGMNPMMGLFGGITDALNRVRGTTGFADKPFGVKIGMIFEDMGQAFDKWYYTGFGREQIEVAATRIGKDMAGFVLGVMGINLPGEANKDGFKNAWYDAGKTAGGSFLKGLSSTIFGGFTSGPNVNLGGTPGVPGTGLPATGGAVNFLQNINNPLARGIGAAALVRKIPGAGKFWPILAAIAAAGAVDEENPLGTALGVGGLALGGFGAFKFARAGINAFRGSQFATGMLGPAARYIGTEGAEMTGATIAERLGVYTAGRSASVSVAGQVMAGGMGRIGQASRIATSGAGKALGVLGRIAGILNVPLSVLMNINEPWGQALGLFQNPYGTSMVGSIQTVDADYEEAMLEAGRMGMLDANGNLKNRPLTGPQGSVIDAYFQAKRDMASEVALGGGGGITIQIDKLADNISAANPAEVEALAEKLLTRITEGLAKAMNNNGTTVPATVGIR